MRAGMSCANLRWQTIMLMISDGRRLGVAREHAKPTLFCTPEGQPFAGGVPGAHRGPAVTARMTPNPRSGAALEEEMDGLRYQSM